MAAGKILRWEIKIRLILCRANFCANSPNRQNRIPLNQRLTRMVHTLGPWRNAVVGLGWLMVVVVEWGGVSLCVGRDAQMRSSA